jgi:Holliday junction DNA helicase RuvB
MSDDGAREIAGRARGTPRVAGRLLRRVRDFANVAGKEVIDAPLADAALGRLDVDKRGLDGLDRRYLSVMAEKFAGGPVGIDTLAAALGEPRDALEDIVEPFLIQLGFVNRTPRGRVLMPAAFEHFGVGCAAGNQRRSRFISWQPIMISGFSDLTHYFNVRVYYEDTDFSGVVYHANYSEICRTRAL